MQSPQGCAVFEYKNLIAPAVGVVKPPAATINNIKTLIMSNEIQNVQELGTPVPAASLLPLSEIECLVSVAKRYPRDVKQSLERAFNIATLDPENAESCVYMLERTDKKGEKTTIEGPSIRFAEIVASQYGNLRVGSRIILNDGKQLVAEGYCFDAETNYAVSKQVSRRITYKNGSTYSEDMQNVTGNAAQSIAMRNAIFTVVPLAILKPVLDRIKEFATQNVATAEEFEKKKNKTIQWFTKRNVTEAEILKYFGLSNMDQINAEHVVKLISLANSVKDGYTTLDVEFRPEKVKEEAVAEGVAERKEAMRGKDKDSDRLL